MVFPHCKYVSFPLIYKSGEEHPKLHSKTIFFHKRLLHMLIHHCTKYHLIISSIIKTPYSPCIYCLALLPHQLNKAAKYERWDQRTRNYTSQFSLQHLPSGHCAQPVICIHHSHTLLISLLGQNVKNSIPVKY